MNFTRYYLVCQDHWVYWQAFAGTGLWASRWKDQNLLQLTWLSCGWKEKIISGEINIFSWILIIQKIRLITKPDQQMIRLFSSKTQRENYLLIIFCKRIAQPPPAAN